MPYINQERRGFRPANAGELNFMFTRWIAHYIEDKGKSYQTFNDILGALEGTKLEFYRRVVVPYENAKLTENGDVY